MEIASTEIFGPIAPIVRFSTEDERIVGWIEGLTVEQLNGGSSDAENDVALRLSETYGLRRVGGSDAHYVSAIGRCLTAFHRPVRTIPELVEALVEGDHYPVRVEDTVAPEGA